MPTWSPRLARRKARVEVLLGVAAGTIAGAVVTPMWACPPNSIPHRGALTQAAAFGPIGKSPRRDAGGLTVTKVREAAIKAAAAAAAADTAELIEAALFKEAEERALSLASAEESAAALATDSDIGEDLSRAPESPPRESITLCHWHTDNEDPAAFSSGGEADEVENLFPEGTAEVGLLVEAPSEHRAARYRVLAEVALEQEALRASGDPAADGRPRRTRAILQIAIGGAKPVPIDLTDTRSLLAALFCILGGRERRRRRKLPLLCPRATESQRREPACLLAWRDEPA